MHYELPEKSAWLLLLSAAIPLWWAGVGARKTSLRDATAWLAVAWLAWLIAAAYPLMCAAVTSWQPLAQWQLSGVPRSLLELSPMPFRYLALCMTACAFVAVLGARQPGMSAWNFVIAALAAVLFLPLLEQSWGNRNWHVDMPRSVFLGAILGVGVINYLPTTFTGLALILAPALGLEMSLLASPSLREDLPPQLSLLLVAYGFAVSMWAGALALRGNRGTSAHQTPRAAMLQHWRSFRDCYGLVWGKRVQEQFNAAARHAGYEQRLGWRGLSKAPPADEARQAELLELLRATLKRFGMGQESPS